MSKKQTTKVRFRLGECEADKQNFYASGYFIRDPIYRNDPSFSDRLVWANSADPDQTAPRGGV